MKNQRVRNFLVCSQIEFSYFIPFDDFDRLFYEVSISESKLAGHNTLVLNFLSFADLI